MSSPNKPPAGRPPIKKLRLNELVRVRATGTMDVQQHELRLHAPQPPTEQVKPKVVEGLALQLRPSGGPTEVGYVLYGKVPEPPIQPPSSIGGVLVTFEATEYLVVCQPAPARTPTAIIQPLANPGVLTEAVVTREPGRRELRFSAPGVPVPFRVRLI
jgi:hypothetical protein